MSVDRARAGSIGRRWRGSRTVRPRAGRLAVAVVGVAALASPFAAASASGGSGGSWIPAARSTPAVTGGPATSVVRLITGDVVRLTRLPNGHSAVEIDGAMQNGSGSAFVRYTLGSHLYVIPQSARRYVGTTLDPELFDVTELAAHPQAQLRALVHVDASTQKPSVPGLQLTGWPRSSLNASETPASAKAFGAALSRASDADAAHPAFFDGVVRVSPSASLPRDDTASRAQPPGTGSTVVIKARTIGGAPANPNDGGMIMNVTNDVIYNDLFSWQDGSVTLTGVPDGSYSIMAAFFSQAQKRFALVMLPQFTVHGDTTVSVDASMATSPVSVSTPRPAKQFQAQTDMLRYIANGDLDTDGADVIGSPWRISISPVGRPSIGSVAADSTWELTSPATAPAPYVYEVTFGKRGTIPADQHLTVTPNSLAVVPTQYDVEKARQRQGLEHCGAPVWDGCSTYPRRLIGPVEQTEYLTAGRQVYWLTIQSELDQQQSETLMQDTYTSDPVGHQPPQIWGQAPLHSRLFDAPGTPPGLVICPACSDATDVDLFVTPFSDNSRLHYGWPVAGHGDFTDVSPWSLEADGHVIDNGKIGVEGTYALKPGTTTYRLTNDNQRSGGQVTLSTDARTTWTWPGDVQRFALPPSWYCNHHFTRGCRVLPLMTSSYHLPLDNLGRLAPGTIHAVVDVNHLAPVSQASARLDSLQVSFDGGSTWTSAKVSPARPGTFDVTFDVPAAATYGAIRLHGHDTYGTTLTETIQRAFAVR